MKAKPLDSKRTYDWTRPAAATRGKREGRHRPAQLFRFAPKAFERHAQDRGELPF